MPAIKITADLRFAPDGSYLVHDPVDAPSPYAGWYPVDGGADILGAGDTAEEALEEARNSVEDWAVEAVRLDERTKLFKARTLYIASATQVTAERLRAAEREAAAWRSALEREQVAAGCVFDQTVGK